MNAQPSNRRQSASAYAVRFLLWVFAAFSFADFPHANADSSRLSKASFSRVETELHVSGVERRGDIHVALAADDERSPDDGFSGQDPILDADDIFTADSVLPPGKALNGEGVAIAACPDDQSFAAFNSRAPPVFA